MTRAISIAIDNEPRPLRLTLGALAAIEEAFGGDLETLKDRLASPRVGDILIILHALLLGGGARLTLEALKAADVDLAAAAEAIAASFEAMEAPGKPVSGAGGA